LKISLYVSDHGYGHATRSIALARALAAQGGGDLQLEVLNHHAHGLLHRSLSHLPGVSVLDRTTDVGFVCREDRLALDPGATALRVSSWIGGWKRFVSEEVERLRRAPPDLVVSDVAPEPLLVAERLGTASVLASNFTWVDQYEPHLRANLVAPLRGAYALAARAHTYVMRTPLSGVRHKVPAGLVTRQPRRDRADVRRSLGVPPGQRLVHLGLGWSAEAASAAQEIDLAGLQSDVRVLLSANLAPLLASSSGSAARAVTIPSEDIDAHESIAACDLVVAKAGYSTIAEAIAGSVPVLAIPVEGSVESRLIARTVEQLGVGRSTEEGAALDGGIFARAADMLDELDLYRDAYRRLPAEYAPNAATRLARSLLESPPLSA